jgi:hypothetical protein
VRMSVKRLQFLSPQQHIPPHARPLLGIRQRSPRPPRSAGRRHRGSSHAEVTISVISCKKFYDHKQTRRCPRGRWARYGHACYGDQTKAICPIRRSTRLQTGFTAGWGVGHFSQCPNSVEGGKDRSCGSGSAGDATHKVAQCAEPVHNRWNNTNVQDHDARSLPAHPTILVVVAPCQTPTEFRFEA